MPGEKRSAVNYILLFDVAAKQKKNWIKQFKDQTIAVWSQPVVPNTRVDESAESANLTGHQRQMCVPAATKNALMFCT